MKKLKTLLKNQRTTFIVFLVAFGIIGGLIIIFSRAAVIENIIEPEQGALSGNATKNSAASTSGEYVQFNAASTSTAGNFRTVGSDIVDPYGYKHIPIGWNMFSKVRNAIGGSETGSFINQEYTIDGHAAAMAAKGFTNIRVMSQNVDGVACSGTKDAPAAGGDADLQKCWFGLATAIDELAANKIVAQAAPTWDFTNAPNKNPSASTVINNRYSYWTDQIIARYKPGGTYQGANRYEANAAGFNHPAGGSPYVWLDMMNEPWDYNNLPGWVATYQALYDRAYSQGWRGIFIAEAPAWAQYIQPILDNNSIFEQVRSGRPNIVIGWHYYETFSNLTQVLQAFKTKGVPIATGEQGFDKDPNYHGTHDGISQDSARQAGADMYANAFKYSSPGYVGWASAWNGYWSPPNMDGSADVLKNTTKTQLRTYIDNLAASKPAPVKVQ